eukprot:TRINITY_DN503_c0_g1_i2.p1 TRINITY_DN503_c0_g1~~TRINITY_DN503_c0_g1_i2.p1  ORF type:complete len:305 (-),score=108.43 TRINITY_DN503_c0_g1_i2:68-982(-)
MASLGYFMDSNVYIILVLFSVFVIFGGLWVVWKIAEPPKDRPIQEEEEEQEDAGNANRGNRRALDRLRARRNAVADPQPQPVQDDQEPEDEGEEGEEFERDLTGKKMGAKKMKKMAEKEERARAREAMEEAKKARLEQEEREILDRKRKQKEEEEKQRLEDEELERLRQERKKKEEEEYALLKESFSVEDAGSVSDDKADFESKTQQFIDEIISSKVVFLEDLAVKYNMETKVVADKIIALENEGRLSGIIDERGKFIYITAQEMTNIAKFIKKRGRVNISEIVKESNKLIDLVPKVSPTEEQD